MRYNFRFVHVFVSCIASVLIVGTELFVFNAHAESTVGDASIKIMQPIQIIQSKALNAGTVVKKDNDVSWVEVDINSKRTGSANLALEDSSGVSNGQFTITSSPSSSINISVDRTVTLSNEKGQTLTATIANSGQSVVLNGSGKGTYKTGFRIDIPNNSSGVFNGTYSVTVSN